MASIRLTQTIDECNALILKWQYSIMESLYIGLDNLPAYHCLCQSALIQQVASETNEILHLVFP